MSCCTDATLRYLDAGLYECDECGRQHRAGADVRRCHGCAEIFLVTDLKRSPGPYGGEFCSDVCKEGFQADVSAEIEAGESVVNPRIYKRGYQMEFSGPLLTPTCEGCSKSFETRDPRKRCCNRKCAQRASYLRKRQEEQAS